MIVNSNSLVLSSDGAVTVKGKKTFTGVKKMLELCSDPTMVIMFYGKPDFGLVDIESTIEEFKKQINFDKLNTVKDISSKFIEFLKEYTYPDDVESFVKYNLALFKRNLIKNIENMDERLFRDYLDGENKLDVLSFIGDISFNDIVPDEIQDDDYENEELLKIFSYYLSYQGTGVVIAGFDNDSNRPSFIHLGLMVNNGGDIEYEILDYEKDFEKSCIISFAQDDEINTFIYGIDSELEDSIVNYIKVMPRIYFDDFYHLLCDSGDFDEETLKTISYHKLEFEKEFFEYEKFLLEKIEGWKYDNYNSFIEIIPFLPKHLLADFAKFLISIVSSRRRFSFDLESVGGNIDVCVVTKNQIQFFEYEQV